MHAQGPQFSLGVTLQETAWFLPLAHRDFKHLAVLGSCENLVTAPVDATYAKAFFEKKKNK